MAREPYWGKKTTEDGKYLLLHEVIQSSSSGSEYDYPNTRPIGYTLDLRQLQQDEDEGEEEEKEKTADLNMSEETNQVRPETPAMPAQQLEKGADSSTSSCSESSDSEAREPTIIRQVSSKKQGKVPMDGSIVSGEEDDNKLYITGNLVDNDPPLSFKSSTGSRGGDSKLIDEGIYQGLVMTDRQKKNLGILPESLYMTTDLIQRGDILESVSLALATAVEVPEVPLASDADPVLQEKLIMPTYPPRPTKSAVRKVNSVPISTAPSGGSNPPQAVPDSMPSASRGITPHYRGLILRPPPLPPVNSGANRAERKAHAVVEFLLKSEAAYLTSLKIAISIYMRPLLEMAEGPSPILSQQEIETIFGSIDKILPFQEIFYCAITTRTVDWTPQEKIGDILSSLNNKDVIQNYSAYVNNFTSAMAMLQKAMNKKPRFIQFLKDRYANSKTSLSLQGLLLKPVQRFPQYIMFLQDLLKYTSTGHPDRINLQVAMAHFEGIANFLNESKRQREQKAVVQNLTNKVSHLPFKLTDGKRWLYRQDIVTRLMMLNGRLVKKQRCLLLFNNLVLCAALRRRKKKGTAQTRKEELESTTGSRDFQAVNDSFYKCKWHCPLNELEVIQPDYFNDIWDQCETNSEYVELKEKYKMLEQDFGKVSQIASIAASLHEEYAGFTVANVAHHMRVLQRKIAKLKEELKREQQGRMDILLPNREVDGKVCHTYAFQSERNKLDWVNDLRYSKRKLSYPVSSSWVIAEDVSEGDIFEVSYKLPLFVESHKLSMIDDKLLSVHCATKVGQSCAWLASGDHSSAQVSIVECVTPTPLILECFNVNSKRIIDILYVPPSSFCLNAADNTLTSDNIRKNSQTLRESGSGSLTTLPPYMPTVWMGAQCGKLSIYCADSAGDGSKQCLTSLQLTDAITSLQYYKDKVFVTTAEGDIVIFKRSTAGFNLTASSTVPAQPGLKDSICCSCEVGNKLWMGIKGSCHILNMQTHKMEKSVKMTSDEGVVVSHMVNQGEGVWVSYRGNCSLELLHTTSKQTLQNIDIKSAMNTIIKRCKLESRLNINTRTHVTSLMASHGYLWIGTSIGTILVYHIPFLDSVPIVSGKPYLAMDAHSGSVRVLLTVETMATAESLRLELFLVDEYQRSMADKEIEESKSRGDGMVRRSLDSQLTSHDTVEGQEVRGRSSSVPDFRPSGGKSRRSVAILEESEDISIQDVSKEASILDVPEEINVPEEISILGGHEDAAVAKEATKESNTEEVAQVEFERSVTPQLPHPSTVALEDSVAVSGENPPVIINNEQEETAKVNGEKEMESMEEVSMDDYESDELEMKRKFGGGIRPVAVTQSDDKVNSDRIELQPLLLENSLRDSGDYDVPKELNAFRARAGVLNGRDYKNSNEGPYSVPYELDSVDSMTNLDDSQYHDPTELSTMKRFPTLEAEARAKDESPYNFPSELIKNETGVKGESPYDFPAELVKSNFESSGHPYEDPTTLAKDPSTPLAALFSPRILNKGLSVGKPPKEGAIFVLTAGRGLINLRSGKRAANFNQLNKDTEGAMMAYEIEI